MTFIQLEQNIYLQLLQNLMLNTKAFTKKTMQNSQLPLIQPSSSAQGMDASLLQQVLSGVRGAR